MANSPSWAEIAARVALLNAKPHLVCVYATGATAELLPDMVAIEGDLLPKIWGPAGASRTLLEYRFSYAQEATIDALGGRVPEKFLSVDAAIMMAAAAYEKGIEYAVRRGKPGAPIIGVGITSAVSTTRARRGDDRAFICVRTPDGFFVVDVELDKADNDQGARDGRRLQQARIIDHIALNTILWAAGVETLPVDPDGLNSKELGQSPTGEWFVAPRPVGRVPILFHDRVFWPERDDDYPDGRHTPVTDLDWNDYIIFPGSFNPVHFGHVEMAEQMERLTGKRVIFQISGTHPVKGVVPDEDLQRRLMQFKFRWPVIVTKAAGLYVDKAEQFPGAGILIGADALLGLLDTKYYDGGEIGMEAALRRFRQLGTHFYVVDRVVDGRLRTLKNIPILPEYLDMFQAVTSRNDISSTAIRASR